MELDIKGFHCFFAYPDLFLITIDNVPIMMSIIQID